MTGFLSSTGWSWFSHISFAPETEAPKSECIGCGENQEERERGEGKLVDGESV